MNTRITWSWLSILLVAILALLVVIQPVSGTPGVTINVSGTITGPSGGVPNVTIRLYSGQGEWSTTTNSSGSYSVNIDHTAGESISFAVRPALADRLSQANYWLDSWGGGALTQDFSVEAGHLLEVEIPEYDGAMWLEVYPRNWTLGPTEWYEMEYDGLTGRFRGVLPADVYNISTFSEPPGYFRTTGLIDARSGDASLTMSLNTTYVSPVPADPPDASKITFGPLNSLGETVVSGAPGSVMPLTNVLLVNLKTSHSAFIQAEADGSFSGSLFAPPGSDIDVRYGTPHWRWDRVAAFGADEGLNPYPGTIIHRPHEHSGGQNELPFATVGAIEPWQTEPNSVGAAWQIEGLVKNVADPLYPGYTVDVDSIITVYGHDIDAETDLKPINIHGYVYLMMTHKKDGTPVLARNYPGSSRQTPTGFPIIDERVPQEYIREISVTNLAYKGINQLTGELKFSLPIPADLPPGTYRPVLYMFVNNVPVTKDWERATVSYLTYHQEQGVLPPLLIAEDGEPIPERQVVWNILMNDLSQGQRGTSPRETADFFRPSSFIIQQSAPYIIPAVDPLSGAPITYRLEPFLPMISFSDREAPTPPQIPFDLPGGEACLVITTPSGQTEDFDCHELVQSAHRTPTTRHGDDINTGTEQVKDYYELRIDSDTFLHQFEEYGRYEISLTGEVQDIWGSTYHGGGTYELYVADTLDMIFGTLPGTPLAVGDYFNPALQFQPEVPAEVDLTITHYPNSNPALAVTKTFSGLANEFGLFSPKDNFQFETPGEYRVDILATYQQPDSDKLFMASAAFGGVVMSPNPDMVAHGRRGMDSLLNVPPNAWFINCNTLPAAPTSLTAHMFNPYFNGDVVWSREEEDTWGTPWGLSCDGGALRMVASLQDPTGIHQPAIEARAAGMSLDPLYEVSLADRYAGDELPVFSSSYTNRPLTMVEPADVEQLAYAYLYSQRPGVRVREVIAEEGPEHLSGYWRLDTLYDDQLGVGINGDLPNDFKFQYVGIVYRDVESGYSEYLGHGSSWIHLPDGGTHRSRAMPPFSGPGNGGWPTDGGPLLRLKGQDIHMFIMPTGVRPGSVLETGDLFRFAGHLMPTLDSQVQATITAPDGTIREVSGRANSIGYFYNPKDDFEVNQPGLWQVDVQVWHDGTIGNGDPVDCDPAAPFDPTRPCPSGNVLGSSGGQYVFYVVYPGAPRLFLTAPSSGILYFRHAVSPIAVRGVLPKGFTADYVDYTISMPGVILETGRAALSGNSFSFNFDPVALQADFPNIDLNRRDDTHPGLSDTFAITLLYKGHDEDGDSYRANTITVQGDRVFAAGVPAAHGVFLPTVVR